MPEDGSAYFSGAIAYVDDVPMPDYTIVGEVGLTADFGDETLTGGATNFAHMDLDEFVPSNPTPLDGSLDIDGTFVGADITASYDGEVDGGAVAGDLVGSFLGDDADQLILLGDTPSGNVVIRAAQ